MNLAHVHIVLNHIPSIGTVVATILFAAALVKKNDPLKKLSLQVLVLMTLVAIPTYVSGNAAHGLLRDRTEIPRALIEVHQNSAIVTIIFMTILGTFAWFGLWQFRRFSSSGSLNSAVVLIFSILSSAFILRTASMGGEISHPEIRPAQAIAFPEDVGWRAPFERFTNDQSWVWPASEALHFVGMALLFGVALLVCVRVLGMMTIIPFRALHRLLPLGILGFVLNVFSGMVFFIASPGMYTTNPGFIAKIALILVAGICVIYFTAFDGPWAVGQDRQAPLAAKLVAVFTMSSLLGVMYFGRMLPFLRQY